MFVRALVHIYPFRESSGFSFLSLNITEIRVSRLTKTRRQCALSFRVGSGVCGADLIYMTQILATRRCTHPLLITASDVALVSSLSVPDATFEMWFTSDCFTGLYGLWEKLT